MRLFVAIELSNEVKEYLVSLQKKLVSPDAKISISKSHHLTLEFLGEVPETKLELIKAKLQNIKFSSFQLTTFDIGFFPDQKNPRVIWASVMPHDEVKNLQKEIDSALKELGFKIDKRFHPHLTLARVGFIKNKTYLDKIKEIKTEKLNFLVSSFILFRSDLLPTGPVHTELLRINAKI